MSLSVFLGLKEEEKEDTRKRKGEEKGMPLTRLAR